ncbi:hypothetical protein V6N13_009344 [Hibiscus sabdariffa]
MIGHSNALASGSNSGISQTMLTPHREPDDDDLGEDSSDGVMLDDENQLVEGLGAVSKHIVVYTSLDAARRKILWGLLANSKPRDHTPSVLGGDFIALLSNNERIGGSEANGGDFNVLLADDERIVGSEVNRVDFNVLLKDGEKLGGNDANEGGVSIKG